MMLLQQCVMSDNMCKTIWCLFYLFTLQCVIVVNLLHHMVILPWVPVVLYSFRFMNLFCSATSCPQVHPAPSMYDPAKWQFKGAVTLNVFSLSLVFMFGLCHVGFFTFCLNSWIIDMMFYCKKEKKNTFLTSLAIISSHSMKFSINAFQCKMSVIVNKSNVVLMHQSKMSVNAKYKEQFKQLSSIFIFLLILMLLLILLCTL